MAALFSNRWRRGATTTTAHGVTVGGLLTSASAAWSYAAQHGPAVIGNGVTMIDAKVGMTDDVTSGMAITKDEAHYAAPAMLAKNEATVVLAVATHPSTLSCLFGLPARWVD